MNFYAKFEKQTREVFYNMLKRMGAFLDGPTRPVPDAGFPSPGSGSPPPRVSVVIPVFNRKDFIGRAITSVLSGNYGDFEIIVVDNGSVDGTIDRVEPYVRQDPRVRLIKNQKNVIAYSLNIGLKAAHGRYIAQLDSDDEYTPDTLKEMVEYLDAHPHCAVAISYYEMIDGTGQTLEKFGVIKHLEYDRNNILRTDGAGAVRVWRRQVLMEFGGFNEEEFGNYGEDYDMILKVSEKYDVGRVHKVLYKYRQHQGNTDKKMPPYLRYRNKMLARLYAIERRTIGAVHDV